MLKFNISPQKKIAYPQQPEIRRGRFLLIEAKSDPPPPPRRTPPQAAGEVGEGNVEVWAVYLLISRSGVL